MGIPDFIGCYQGRFFAIETKTKNGTPTLRQTLVMGAIRKAGGLVWVVNEGNVEDVPLMLKGERNDC